MGTADVIVTGASGFVGAAVATRIAGRGGAVRGTFFRGGPPQRMRRLQEASVHLDRCDLTTEAGASEAVRGAGAVVHCAAAVTDWATRAHFRMLNTELTARVAAAAARAGCRRFVYASSAAVHGFGSHRSTSEAGPFYRPVNAYQTTKLAAEVAAATAFRDTTILRLGNVYGPDDTTSFYRILAALERGLPAFVCGGRKLTCPVFVDDVAQAFVRALDCPSAGHVLLITGGEWVRWRDLLGHACVILGCAPPRWSVPGWLARTVARVLEVAHARLRLPGEPAVTVYRTAQAGTDYHFSIARAREILDYRPVVGYREGVRRAVAAYRAATDGSVR